MVAAALGQGQQVVVLVAKHRGAAEHHHLGHGAQPAHRVVGPGRRRLAIHSGVAGQQPATGLGLFVSQDHASTRCRSCQRSAQAGQAAASHQHITKGKAFVVVVGVGLARRLAQAAGLADVVLKKVPGFLRGHEGLVIKTSGQKTGKPAVDAAQVKFDAGLGVNGLCAQAVDQFYLGHAGVGHSAGAVKQLYQRIGLFDTGAQDAARAVVFPASCHQRHAIGQQGRGQRVTGQALKAAAIEAEAQGRAALHASARTQAAVTGAHADSLVFRAAGAGSPIFQTASKR